MSTSSRLGRLNSSKYKVILILYCFPKTVRQYTSFGACCFLTNQITSNKSKHRLYDSINNSEISKMTNTLS